MFLRSRQGLFFLFNSSKTKNSPLGFSQPKSPIKTLYFIILSEFHPIVYNVVKSTDKKCKIIVDAYHKDKKSSPTVSISHVEGSIFGYNFHYQKSFLMQGQQYEL